MKSRNTIREMHKRLVILTHFLTFWSLSQKYTKRGYQTVSPFYSLNSSEELWFYWHIAEGFYSSNSTGKLCQCEITPFGTVK